MTKLSEHFSLEEMTFSETASRKGFDNTPSASQIANLVRVATMLEQVRKITGKPIQISSGYRCKELNQAVGSSETSQHRLGCAADIKVAGMTPNQVVEAIIASDIQYDQLIREFDSWVHISVPNTPDTTPRGQTLIIDKSGTRPYIKS